MEIMTCSIGLVSKSSVSDSDTVASIPIIYKLARVRKFRIRKHDMGNKVLKSGQLSKTMPFVVAKNGGFYKQTCQMI